MYGVVTRNAEELSWSEFDRGFYEVKDVTGRQEPPVEGGANAVSCHADTNASREDDLVPVDDEGRPATRDRPYFEWGHVCPTHEGYRDGLLELIAECGATAGDVRLDDVGFPRQEYCYCDRCVERFRESEYDDRLEWRASVITDFLADARERVPGRLYLTLFPDPYPGHLCRRSGIDPEAAAEYVDELVVPIYDEAYATTYWLEVLASGFADELSTPFSIELYAVGPEVDDLIHATEVAGAYAEHVYFGYDAGNARAAIRRMRASERDGATYGK